MIKLTINDKTIEVKEDKTVLEASLDAGIYIPNLCYHPDLPSVGACRLCIVKIDGIRGFPTSCTTTVRDGMVIQTNTDEIQKLRKNLVWLILTQYPKDIPVNSQLQKVIDWVGVDRPLYYFPQKQQFQIVIDEPLFVRDVNRCILCGRCVRMCQQVREAGVLGFINRGIEATIGTSFNIPITESACRFCGACVEVCPSGALTDKEKYDETTREAVLVPCENSCPANVDVPRYVRLIAEGKYQESLEVIREKAPFPHSLGCVCFHPCETDCRRTHLNDAVSIRNLKRFAAENSTDVWKDKIDVKADTGKKVAVIGAGPAGLTAAWYLRLVGHSITVFEALPKAGGTMRTGIPPYRLPRTILDKEIKDIEDFGVEIKLNSKIESLDELFEEGFDAIFLGLGAVKGTKMRIDGADDPRVLDGMSVLENINLGRKTDIKGRVVVVGGGNVAIDVTRSALRVGARKVDLVYRRSRKEMPAHDAEIEDALKEGVNLNLLVNPIKVNAKEDKLEVECVRMRLGEPDSSGRRRPVPIPDSEFVIDADYLVMAIGQKPDVPEDYKLEMTRWKTIVVENETTFNCSREGVFAAGDVVSGPASVIEAIRDARLAASAIDKYLGGTGEIEQAIAPEEGKESRCKIGRIEKFSYLEREELDVLEDIEKRLKGFDLVEFGFDEEKALAEASRCLRCQFRLTISKVPMPPVK